jgi:hypothetical protein
VERRPESRKSDKRIQTGSYKKGTWGGWYDQVAGGGGGQGDSGARARGADAIFFYLFNGGLTDRFTRDNKEINLDNDPSDQTWRLKIENILG